MAVNTLNHKLINCKIFEIETQMHGEASPIYRVCTVEVEVVEVAVAVEVYGSMRHHAALVW